MIRLRTASLSLAARLLRLLAIFGFLLSFVPASLGGASITTFSGVVTTLSTGATSLDTPAGIAVDESGNVYIADTNNNQIVKISADGTASVLTLTGLTTALNTPIGIAVDESGTLYIADNGNSRIVQVIGTAATVVAMGSVTLSSPQGVAIDASGNLFIADATNNSIVELPAGGTAAIFAITGLVTGLNAPMGLAVDVTGNLYIADSVNNRIVAVTPSGVGSVVSITGLSPTLSTPHGVAIERHGSMYIADTGNNRIVIVTPAGFGSPVSTGIVTLNQPEGVAVNIFGTVYVADTTNNQSVSVAASAVGFGHVQLGTTTGIAQTLPFGLGSTPMGSIKAFTLGTENLDFTVTGQNCLTVTANPRRGCTVQVQFLPTAPGLRRGALVLYDNASPPNPLITVPLYGFSDAPVAALAPNAATVISTGAVITEYPFQLALDGAGNMYVGNYVQDIANPEVVKIAAGGGTTSVVSTAGITLGPSITGIAVDGAGNLFIADYYQSQIVVVTPGGLASVLSISGLIPVLGTPTALAFDAAGNLYIADYSLGRVVEVSSIVVAVRPGCGACAVRSGCGACAAFTLTSSGLGMVLSAGSYTFSANDLTGVAVGLTGTVYIAAATSNSGQVVQVTAAGATSVLNPTGLTLSGPQGAFVDAMGNLYLEDAGNSRIVRITTAGVASVVSVPGLTSPSTLAQGFGVAADAAGNIYIPDWTNNRVVYLSVAGSSLAFADTAVALTSTDSPKTTTVTNLGNLSLDFATDPTYTADFPQDSGNTTPCTISTSLAAGDICNVMVKFTPQSAASLTANIVVTNNSLNVTGTTQLTAVSGTGLKSLPTVALIASGNPVLVSTAVTFTASYSSSAGAPTGLVTFTDGTTVLGSGTLASGVATYTTSSLTAGTHTITASYGGDTAFTGVSSTALSLLVSDFAITLTTGGAQTETIPAGGTATFKFTIAPSSGTVLPASVVFSATGAPTGSTVTFTPPTLNVGDTATDVTLTIKVPAQAAVLHQGPLNWQVALLFAGILILPLGAVSRKRISKHSLVAGLFLLALVSAGALNGCGVGGTATKLPPQLQKYTVTVTATAATVPHSTTVTVIVQ
jgi:sugar lactone lactonase YvrE